MHKGIIYNLSNKEYHDDRTHFSSSGLKLLYEDPRKFHDQYILGNKINKQEDYFDLGTAFHTKVFEPEKYEHEVAHYSGTVKRGKNYEKFVDENPGKIILKDMQVVQLEQMVEAVSRHDEIQKLLKTPGFSEVAFFTTINNLPVKTKKDRISFSGKFMIDGKTFKDIITKESVKAEIEKRNYDLQAALYMDVANKVLAESGEPPIETYYWLFASKAKKQAVLIEASQETLETGRTKYRKAIMDYRFYQEIGWQFKEEKKEVKEENINECFSL